MVTLNKRFPLGITAVGILASAFTLASCAPKIRATNDAGLALCGDDTSACIQGSEICVKGLCRPFDCNADHLCDANSQVCVENKRCVDRSCIDVACGMGEVCVAGVCRKKSCFNPVENSENPRCVALGSYCDPVTNSTCIMANCSTAVTCPKGTKCVDGICAACAYDADCANGKVCLNAVCTDKSPLFGACVDSAQCDGDGLICSTSTNTCLKQPGSTCSADEECQFLCADGGCTEKPRTTNSSCTDTSQCPAEHECRLAPSSKQSGFFCLKVPGATCTADKECISSFCSDKKCNECVPGRACSFNLDTCMNGKTVCDNGVANCINDKVLPNYSSCVVPTTLANICFNGKCSMRSFSEVIGSNITIIDVVERARPSIAKSLEAGIPVYASYTISPGVQVSSTSAEKAAFSVHGLPPNSVVRIVNAGTIIGAGGKGGTGGGLTGANPPGAINGQNGGHAIETDTVLHIDNILGQLIAGGGGGGGGGGIYWGTHQCAWHAASAGGSGGGGGQGVAPGQGGAGGTDALGLPPGSGNPGKPATGDGPGLGGAAVNGEQSHVSGTCYLITSGGSGGAGGAFGQPGKPGTEALRSGASVSERTDVPPGQGGAAGEAIKRVGTAPPVIFFNSKNGGTPDNPTESKGIITGNYK